MRRAPPWWQPALGLLLFILWGAPVALVVLPLAGVVWITRPRSLIQLALGGGLAAAGGWWLFAVGAPDAQALRAWVLLFTGGLIAGTWLRPGPYLPRALAAIGWAGAATLILLLAVGPSWSEVQWHVRHTVGVDLRRAASLFADSPAILTSVTATLNVIEQIFPALVAWQSLAGGALAWSLATRLGATAGRSLGPFLEFRFTDHLVWAVLWSVVGFLSPISPGLKLLALNVLVFTAGLYVVRGIAILGTAFKVNGVPPGVVIALAALAILLTVPLAIVLPAAWVLGVGDTWIDLRARLATIPTARRRPGPRS